jgi:hypothetical protein
LRTLSVSDESGACSNDEQPSELHDVMIVTGGHGLKVFVSVFESTLVDPFCVIEHEPVGELLSPISVEV